MSSKTPLTARKAGAPREDAQAGPAFNTRARSMSRHSARSDSMPGTFEDSELIPGEQMGDETECTLEKTPKAGSGNEKEGAREIDISEHPYYERETRKHPARYKIRNLEDFRNAVLDENEGPRWYEFLSRAIPYDKTLYEKSFGLHEKLIKTKKHLEQYKQINDRFADEKDEDERQILLVQEELSHKEIELEEALQAQQDLQKEKENLERRLAAPDSSRGQREDTATAQSTTINPQNWRPRGIHPSKPLKGEDAEEYSPWQYSLRNKLKTDSPLYANEGEKVSYSLSQMEAPIFGAMHSWVVDMGDSLTIDALFDEIEHYMGIHLQSRDAKKELITITMKSGESVSEYYHRIFKLWQKAKTPIDERIEKFLVTLKPSISNSLMGSVFTDFRPLLDEARRIEDRRKDVAHYFPPPEKSGPSKNSGREGKSSSGQTSISDSRQSSAKEKKSGDHPNSKFSATIVKPAGWIGVWYDPDPNPKKLEKEERETLSRQGRCWACRGSGHRGNDSICPQFKEKKLNTTRIVEIDSDSESGKA